MPNPPRAMNQIGAKNEVKCSASGATAKARATARRTPANPGPAEPRNFPSIMDLSPVLALRVYCLDACENARSGVRCRGTPGRCSRPYMPAGCSSPCGAHPWRRSGRGTSHRRPSSPAYGAASAGKEKTRWPSLPRVSFPVYCCQRWQMTST